MTSDAAGKFRCVLPPGTYKVTADDFSFFPYRRASIHLDARADVFLKLRTVPGPAIALVAEEDGVHDVPIDPAGPVKYEEVIVNGFDVVVRYGEFEQHANQIIFRGPYLMLTADALAVYGEQISCGEPIRACTATGSVLISLGAEELHDSKAVLDFSSRTLVLSGDPEVVRSF